MILLQAAAVIPPGLRTASQSNLHSYLRSSSRSRSLEERVLRLVLFQRSCWDFGDELLLLVNRWRSKRDRKKREKEREKKKEVEKEIER